MMFVVVVMMAGADRYHAARSGDRTTHMFKLHRGVVDLEMVAQDMVQIMQNVVALRGRHVFNQDVAA